MNKILGRWGILGYGILCYVIFIGTVLYLIAFINNLWVPNGLDGDRLNNLPVAVAIDTLLITIFGLQHSAMARAGFKEKLTKILPPATERSTYVLASSLCLLLLTAWWQPIGITIWQAEKTCLVYGLYALQGLGWLLVLVSTFLLNHFDLVGLRQVYLNFQGKDYQPLAFKTPGLYRFVRHPIYLGFLLGIWFTPNMAIAHLLFAALLTLYILIGARLEERDLTACYGDIYREYQSKVPMLIPKMIKKF